MNDEQYDELRQFVQTALHQSESRLMAHIGVIEQRLHDLEQRANGVQSRMDVRANDLRGEFERMRYALDQLRSHLRT